jgi:hypothetical protein
MCNCVKPFRFYHRPLVWLGIVVPITKGKKGKRGAGNICDQCVKQCIENCHGTCYCNMYTGNCLCE